LTEPPTHRPVGWPGVRELNVDKIAPRRPSARLGGHGLLVCSRLLRLPSRTYISICVNQPAWPINHHRTHNGRVCVAMRHHRQTDRRLVELNDVICRGPSPAVRLRLGVIRSLCRYTGHSLLLFCQRYAGIKQCAPHLSY